MSAKLSDEQRAQWGEGRKALSDALTTGIVMNSYERTCLYNGTYDAFALAAWHMILQGPHHMRRMIDVAQTVSGLQWICEQYQHSQGQWREVLEIFLTDERVIAERERLNL